MSPHTMDAVAAAAEAVREVGLPPAPGENETGNGRRLVAMFGADLRYVYEARAWYVWTDTHWAPDARGVALARTADVAEAIRAEALAMDARTQEDRAGQVRLLKWGDRSLSESVRVNTLALAAVEPGMTVTLGDFDGDPWLLNVANGTLDLRTRELRPHRREDLFTYCLPVEYHEGATCPRWDSFVLEVFGGDGGVVDFVQRAAGYSLTGLTIEQCLFILYGLGANGKSVFVNTLRYILGPLAVHANIETFSARDSGRIPEDRARLRGARVVTVSESNRGQVLDEAFVKDTCGGEPVTARRLHENSSEFTPQFKAWIATNHKPTITGTDTGIWRRIRLIPFARTFAPSEQDHELADTLRGEAPGILAWLVEGCRKWQDQGLSAPALVEAATNEYRTESDTMGQFIEERCTLARELSGAAGDLYRAYTAWADENGFRPMSSTRLGLSLKERGFEGFRFSGQRHYRGITVTR